MTTDPLVRRFNPAGPNYGPSGLDTLLRDEERRHVARETVPIYAKLPSIFGHSPSAARQGGAAAQTSEV